MTAPASQWRDAGEVPLPSAAHIPGRTPRPDDGLLETVCALADAQTQSDRADGNFAWQYGLRLFQEDFYWECHEVLETVWMNARPNSREKHLVQAVIHLANARLKVKMGRPSAAERLFTLAEETAQRAFESCDTLVMGMDKDGFDRMRCDRVSEAVSPDRLK